MNYFARIVLYFGVTLAQLFSGDCWFLAYKEELSEDGMMYLYNKQR